VPRHLAAAAKHADVLIAHIGRDQAAGRFERRLAGARRVAVAAGRHLEVRHLSGIAHHGFRVPHHHRDEVVRVLTDWLDEAIDRRVPEAAVSRDRRTAARDRTLAGGDAR
jgi:hypothetical protein